MDKCEDRDGVELKFKAWKARKKILSFEMGRKGNNIYR